MVLCKNRIFISQIIRIYLFLLVFITSKNNSLLIDLDQKLINHKFNATFSHLSMSHFDKVVTMESKQRLGSRHEEDNSDSNF